ncbi:hypothetical protein BGX23_007651 [Mortierella sp. AD031]|nr:hypothetical protein BGX23_007651 [Mortierella sp. AD031]KAG0210084.1 hypothetical protein BGX33_005146 [Mortierella sp. NVP41]
MQAAHYAQALQQRNAALEAENRDMKALARQHKTSAIDWCETAKIYQQDRNMMTLRLEELEMKLARMAHKKTAGRTDRSNAAATAASSSSSHQKLSGTKATITAAAQTTKVDDYQDDDLEARHMFITQSITQLLDDMTPGQEQKEPPLPILNRTDNEGRGQEVGGTSGRLSTLVSALKNSSRSSNCKCGCQEEIKAWKTRCKYAESQVTAQELRCERMVVIMEAYKTKWTEWRENTLRQQYQRQMKAAMPPNTSQFTLPFEAASYQQQLQEEGSLAPSACEGSFKRARFDTGSSETSQQRQEQTERNTLYNQLTTSFVPGGQADRRKSASGIGRASGKGSAEEPHILVDKDDGSSSEGGFVGMETSPKRRQTETMVLDSSDGNETPGEYEAPVLSPTFPSDMTLHLRQYRVDSDDDDDDSDGYSSPTARSTSTTGNKREQPGQPQESPSARMSRSRNVSTPTNQRHQDILVPDSLASEAHTSASFHDFASDRSSPPMFDTADFMTPHSSTRLQAAGKGAHISPARQRIVQATGAGTTKTMANATTTGNHHSRASKSGAGNGGRRGSGSSEPFTVYEDPVSVSVVLETPLELQGIRGAKPVVPPKPTFEVIEIAEDDHVVQEPVDGGISRGASRGADEDGETGGSDKENDAPVVVVERRDPDGMMEFEEAPVAPGQRDRSPAKAHDPEERERIYNFTERRKNKRKLMHGHNCECCRRFYELTGPLPLPDGYSHFFQPIPRPGEKEVWEKTDEERLQDRIQEVSRHRVHHMPPLTPPGYWNTDFPSTPERKKWDDIDRERRERKRQQEQHQAEQHRQVHKRHGGGGGGSSSRAGPSGASRSKF